MLISIIIPTCNRAGQLRLALESIFCNKEWQDFEVIVVDNGSTDGTAHVCKAFENQAPFTYLYDAMPGLLTGRHLGASKAKGEILCFLDDDVELDATWLNGVKEVFEKVDVHLATGPCVPKFEEEPPAWLNYFWYKPWHGTNYCSWLSLIDLGKEAKEIAPNLVWGLNFCIREKAFVELGGFHPDCIPQQYQMFQGDGETGLTMKAAAKGYRAVYHPNIKLQHHVTKERLTVAYFEKRAFYQGVCNSFTQVRQEHFSGKTSTELKPYRFTRQFFRKIKSLIGDLLSTPLPITGWADDIRVLKERFAQKEKEGFDFHQHAFVNNEKVRNWVLKENYWDYQLPID